MNHSKILTGLFLGMFFIVNAQNDNSHQKLIASSEKPEVIAKKVGPDTFVYSYSGVAQKINTEENQTFKESDISSLEKNDVFQYPPMRSQEGAVLPFEMVFNGVVSSTEGIKTQEYYFNSLMLKPEQNKIVYQNIETTRERLNNAGIFDAADLKYFDMPLIAKIVGAGVLITGKITVNNKKVDSSPNDTKVASEAYNTEVIFKIYNRNGRVIFTKKEAPFTATTIDSYHTTLDYMMKQTPYYHKF